MTTVDSIQIHLNSANATSYINGDYSNCIFNLKTIEVPIQHTIYLKVVHANIPYTFYNIDSTNNTLFYTQNGNETQLTITKGNYNANQLANYFTNNMTNFTCTYNSITNRFTFINSLYNFYFAEESTCLTMLGFPAISLYLTSALKQLDSYFCANLQTKQCICVASNFMTGNINSTDVSTRNMLCSIPIATQPYSNIVYKNDSNFRNNLYTNVISTIALKLVDQNNNLINLNGCHWSITLQMDVIDFVVE